MKKLIAIAVLLIVTVAVLIKQTKNLVTTAAKPSASSISTAALSTSEFHQAIHLVKISQEGSVQTFLIENFLSIDLSRGGKRSQQALQVLLTALRSRDDLTQKEALQQTKSLLIDVAHGHTEIDHELKAHLNDLFRTFKIVGSSEVRLIAKANPQSPTLTYLHSLR